MKCSRCLAENGPEMRFCGQCGNPLERACPRCGKPWPGSLKFCGECGASLEISAVEPERTATPAPEAELRQVTAVAGELLFDAPEALDVEARYRQIQHFAALAREEMERFGGSLEQASGPSFVALFGAPIAQEDHARRALLAAQSLRNRLLEPPSVQASPPGSTLRLALASGLLVLGEPGSVAVGEPLERAQSLRQATAPGALWLTAATAGQVVGELRPVPGSPAPEAGEIFELPAEVRLPSVSQRSGRPESPFVGRRRELAVLEELLAEAEHGRGQVVGIAGDAGAGKSRLLAELRRRYHARGLTHLAGQCLSYGSGVPYLPLVDLVRRASHLSSHDSPAQMRAKLLTRVEAVGAAPEDLLPALLHLLGVREGAGALDRLEPHALQARLFQALRALILAASRRTPVVMEVEDLHWADETTLAFLAGLVEALGAAPVLLLLTYRAGYQPRFLDRSYATQITLRRLSLEESQTLVSGLLPTANGGGELGREILAKAEGNPLFLEELAFALSQGAGAGAVPDTLQGLLAARIDRLPAEEKRLLQISSVFGREVSVELLQRIYPEPDALAARLEELQRRELLLVSPEAGPGMLRFHHALVKEVTYQSLLPSRRRALHGALAEALESLYAGRLEEVYDRLIYHFPRAGEPARTVHYLRLFAERAAAQYAHQEAAAALEQALREAAALPRQPGARLRTELRLELAESLFPLTRFRDTLEVLEAGRADLEACAEPRLHAQHHFWLAHTYTYLGDSGATREHAQIAVTAAEEAHDEVTAGKAHYVLGRDAFWTGQYAQGLKHSLEAAVLLERGGEAWWQGQAHWVAGFNHFGLGELGQAREAFLRTQRIGEALDDYRLDPSWSLGFLLTSQGDVAAGLAQCRRAVARAQDSLNRAVALGFLGHSQLAAGEPAQAVVSLSEATATLRQAGMQQLLAWLGAYLAQAHRALGQAEEAEEIAEEALEAARGAGFPFGEELLRGGR
ncbi:MAG: AAA family ATPase [Thermoanaerobaculia bacterium]